MRALRLEIESAIKVGVIDQAFARALLDRHPYARDLITPGVERVTVEVNVRGQRSLRVWRTDGSTCFVKKRRLSDETESERIAYAARQAVFDDVIAVKRRLFESGDVRCSITGATLTFANCDMDHAPPCTFSEILRHWLAQLDFAPTTIAKSRDYDVPMLACEAQRECFRVFHEKRMQLRPVAAIENRKDWSGAA